MSLRYSLAGAGATTVVFIHELGGKIESWDGVISQLGGGVRTLAYDQRGAGGSETPVAPFTLADQVGDLAALLDHVGIAKPVVLASCAAGASVALRFAAAWPRRVQGLFLCGPIVNSGNPAGGLERVALVKAGGMRAIEHTLERSYPEAVIRDRAVYERYRARFLAGNAAGYAANLTAFVEAAPIDPVTLSLPARVVAGLHDFTPPAATMTVADALGAACVEIDSGHFMHVQTPQLVAAELQSFLKDLS